MAVAFEKPEACKSVKGMWTRQLKKIPKEKILSRGLLFIENSSLIQILKISVEKNAKNNDIGNTIRKIV